MSSGFTDPFNTLQEKRFGVRRTWRLCSDHFELEERRWFGRKRSIVFEYEGISPAFRRVFERRWFGLSAVEAFVFVDENGKELIRFTRAGIDRTRFYQFVKQFCANLTVCNGTYGSADVDVLIASN